MSKYGRHTVTKNGRTFVVEPISEHAERPADWGSTDLSNFPIGGAVHPKDSIITEENGFKNIKVLGIGESPYSAIDKLLDKDDDIKELFEETVRAMWVEPTESRITNLYIGKGLEKLLEEELKKDGK